MPNVSSTFHLLKHESLGLCPSVWKGLKGYMYNGYICNNVFVGVITWLIQNL